MNAKLYLDFTSAIKSPWLFFVLILVSLPVNAETTDSTFFTQGSKLLDPCGKPLIIRGVNAGIAFPPDPSANDLAEIAKTGANTVRLTFRWLYNHSDPDSVKTAIQQARINKMVAIPAIWDATGAWEQLQFAVDFWSQAEMVEVLRRYEDMILLNIANEAGDAQVESEEYRNHYSQAIRQLRNAGLHMPLVIDASNWGRRESDLLQNAKYLLTQDPDRNLLFSWHPWDIDQPNKRYKTAIDAAVKADIPLLIGEFANTGPHHKGTIDYKYIMEYARKKDIGWLWWWWKSGQPIDSHSMTRNGLYGNWANVGKEVVLTSQYGIKNTSQKTYYLTHLECEVKQQPDAKPNQPSRLKAIATQGAEVKLDWIDNSDNEKHFDIEVFEPSTNSWRLIKVVGSNTTSTTIGANLAFNYSLNRPADKSLAYNTTYQFRVAAYRSKNAVSYSEPYTVTTALNPTSCSEGKGLKADYFFAEKGNHDFVNSHTPVMTRLDPTINFNWGKKSPDSRLANDHFQVRWSGFVKPQFSGQYTFYIKNDNNLAKVWIDGKRIVDNWRSQARGWLLGKIDLVKDEKHSIVMEYRKVNGDANLELHWASSQLTKENIPQCRLFPQ